ncbi:Potassium voltage-gated channel subfamily G member 1 [Nibea albiflora]|uniref:Potassium voltage-gated channel subfamily G member 1 n=1 Tax=Nibea albiflora TaxID=240163 RepID=A0ACB7EMB5_NIBAL|nr:Potassium voltage-gated channel subfamily G member 1 [Nibea albiflora]
MMWSGGDLVGWLRPFTVLDGRRRGRADGPELNCKSRIRRQIGKKSVRILILCKRHAAKMQPRIAIISKRAVRVSRILHEEEAQKGAFYKRAQRAPEIDALHDDTLLSSARKLHAIINVGGLRYQLPWTTLEDFPLSRLGQLHLCSSFDEIMSICDDYDVTHNEFFFDRSPCAFRTILTFLRAGKLRTLREMCALSFREELLYWGVPEESLEWCCRRRLLQRVEEFEAMERAEEEEEFLEDLLDSDSGHREHPAESRLNRCMGKLRDMVERPHSGLPGKIFACLSVLFVTITAINLSISTMPAMREEEEAGTCSQMCYNIFIVETVCVAWFSLEFTLRFIQDRSKLTFLRQPLNLIDVVAILPYYITLVVDSTSKGEKRLGSGSSYLDKVGLVLRVLRALRILYVMRLARHSLGLQTLGLTARRCTREFGLLLLFLCVAIALYSPLLYLIENEMVTTQEFTSIPATYWWAVITMTTVGYGDMVPRSIPGQVVALSSILSGILLMAFPVTSIFHTFSRSYVELKQEQQRVLQRRTHFLLRSRMAGLGSNLSLESDMLFPMGTDTRDLDD